jgi:RepB DNA-primase from phage plasmid
MTAHPEEAIHFLAHFDGTHTFQTFDDRAQKDRTLSRVLHDPAPLDGLNAEGAGVFLMVNEGDGAGRKTENVTRIRAYFADFDGAPLPQVWPLEPSVTVETSPGKFHAYWMLCASEDAALDNAGFNRQQEAVARAVGSQPDDCKGLSRVMRLPGYRHQKGEAFTSRLLSSTGERFTLAQIQAAFPLPASLPFPAISARPTAGEAHSAQTTQAETRRKYALTVLHGLADELSATPEGRRNITLNGVSYKAGRLVGGGHLQRGEVEAELMGAAQAAGLSVAELIPTLQAGLSAGMANPNPLDEVGTLAGNRKGRKAGGEDGDDEESSKRTPAGTRALEYALQDGAELWHDRQRVHDRHGKRPPGALPPAVTGGAGLPASPLLEQGKAGAERTGAE